MEIPPRWLDCPRMGVPVGKFIPFKTPLDARYDEQIPEANRFTIPMFFGALNNMEVNGRPPSNANEKVKVGLMVDLTNTNRYYSKEDVEARGCRHVKIRCRGRGETPTLEQTEAFVRLCARFLEQKPLEYIGVHCTHGFNRTGFLICAFLVEQFSWSIEAAVGSFASVRPPGIYKPSYVDELVKRYGDSSDKIPVPIEPNWSQGGDGFDDDGDRVELQNGEGNGAARGQRRREPIKADAKFMDGVPGMQLVTHAETVHQVRARVQDICEFSGTGFPGSQPVSMDIRNIEFLKQKYYKVSWKADGVRYMMLIDSRDQIFMVDRDNNVFQVPRIEFPSRKDPKAHIRDTLLDGEMILDKNVNGTITPRYLVYDIVRFQGKEVGKCAFATRERCIDLEIVQPRTKKIVEGHLDKDRETFRIRKKDFWPLVYAPKLLDKEGSFQKQMSHEVDGLIFQPVPDAYKSGRFMDLLKWKPPDQNSVDFRLNIVREEKIGCLPETKGYLYVGGLEQPFDCMKVTKELRRYDGKIIECRYNGTWQFMRERTDKSFPNGYRTAMGVCESIKHPVTEQLLNNLIMTESFEVVEERRRQADQSLMPPPAKRRALAH